MAPLFDPKLRAARRDRAARTGPELFLSERAFEDCLERLSLMERTFGRALLIGCPDPNWPHRLSKIAEAVDVRDPGGAFAAAAGGSVIVEDAESLPHDHFDLVLAVGTLDTVDNLPVALRSLRQSLRPEGLLMGAMSGGDTLPMLRAAMRAGDAVRGDASAHVHPRIEAAAVAPLLEAAGFSAPVIDVDRVSVSYTTIDKLVGDLRRMGATNILHARSRRPFTRKEYQAAADAFAAVGDNSRTKETFEILNFAAWAR